MNKAIGLLGKKINRLTILDYIGNDKVVAKCECGREGTYNVYAILRGNTKSCGCYNSEISTTHGLSDHPLYRVWRRIIRRCYNKRDGVYKNYGGRGVTVSLRWLNDFKAFFDWAIDKWRPGLSIDKDIRSGGNSGNMYAPETCCFVTQKENNSKRSNNVYLTYNGETKCLMEWSEITHISYYTLLARIQRFGWPSEKALTVIPKTNYTR